MRRIFGTLFWLVVVGGLMYGGYVAYVRWWGGEDFVKNKLNTAISDVKQKVEDTTQRAKDRVIKSTEDTISSYLKKKTADVIGGVGEQLQSFATGIVGEEMVKSPQGLTIRDITGNNSITTRVNATSSSFDTPPPPASIITKIGVPFVFSIGRGVRYNILWGDGIKDDGPVPTDAVKLVSHFWETQGDFIVTIRVEENNKKTFTYELPVRVYE